MKRYIALLRAVNISGKNKVSMTELKSSCEEFGFSDVRTYLNSGNVIFSSDVNDEIFLAKTICKMISDRFALNIPVFVIAQDKLHELFAGAPDWWGTENKEIYHNLIFVIPPVTAESIAEKIGEPTTGLEQICICGNSVFWSFDREKYNKSNWWKKTASVGVAENITIRNANTLRKIALM